MKVWSSQKVGVPSRSLFSFLKGRCLNQKSESRLWEAREGSLCPPRWYRSRGHPTHWCKLSVSDIPLSLVMSYFSKKWAEPKYECEASDRESRVHGDFRPGLDTGTLYTRVSWKAREWTQVCWLKAQAHSFLPLPMALAAYSDRLLELEEGAFEISIKLLLILYMRKMSYVSCPSSHFKLRWGWSFQTPGSVLFLWNPLLFRACGAFINVSKTLSFTCEHRCIHPIDQIHTLALWNNEIQSFYFNLKLILCFFKLETREFLSPDKNYKYSSNIFTFERLNKNMDLEHGF